MKNIIFISPPAGGKGTQSKLISDKYNIPHISTGDLLRNEINNGSEIGNIIKEKMDKGLLIEDEIITNLLENRIRMKDCDNGYILDGYPRNSKQAETYEDLLNRLKKDLGVVIFLDIDKDLALERAVGRITCPSCGSSYNLIKEGLKPKEDGICNRCGKELKVRSDDNEETFLTRFDTYMDSTKELIDYYKNKNLLNVISVDKDKSTIDIFNEIEEILNRD